MLPVPFFSGPHVIAQAGFMRRMVMSARNQIATGAPEVSRNHPLFALFVNLPFNLSKS
jgi:hypothetical protein